jgi:hypothetical protein
MEMSKQKFRRAARTVVFEIETAKPLPVGEQVFIAGSADMLGAWAPDGFPLTRLGENLWSASAILPSAETVEYKVTRGSWDTEEALESGESPANSVLEPGGDEKVARRVAAWKDRPAG